LVSQLRQQGVEKIADVKKCRLESNGHFSVIKKDGPQDVTGGKGNARGSAS
jgi:uncharacterized membrane protein YcaP (DUF421 family)